MALKVKDRAKPKLPPVEPGVYLAVCVGVIDLGEQYSEKFKNYRNEVQFVWELAGETVEVDGEQKPRQLSRTFSVAASKKSNLRGFLGGWNGVQYSDEQFQDLDLFGQAGRPCQLNVVLNDTGEYANVDSVIPLPKGMPAPQAVSPTILWNMDEWSDEKFSALPDWVQEKIKKSTQYQKDHTPTDPVDFPVQTSGPQGDGGCPI
jgi:hypothetical protein|nr:MAG TPA: ATP synthase [Caudoviricetes sp.]